jgi:ATP-dependent Clp protease ATP-binding subunit ClpA
MISELGSRVDDVIHFEPLNNVSMTAIVHQQLQQAVAQARQQGVLLQVDPAAAAWLASSGCSDSQGARPLVQLIRRHVLVPLAAALMEAVAGGGKLQGVGQGEGVWAVAVFAMVSGGARGIVPELQLQKLQ